MTAPTEQLQDRAAVQGLWRIIMRRWPMTLLLPLLLAAAAYGAAYLLPSEYRSTANITVFNFSYGINQTNLSRVPAANLVPLLRHAGALREIYDRFEVDRKLNCSFEQFVEERVAVSVAEKTDVVQIAVQLGDRDMAAAVANAIADDCSARVMQVIQSQHERVMANLEDQQQQNFLRLQQCEKELEEFYKESEVEKLRSLVEVEKSLFAVREERLKTLDLELTTNRKRMEYAKDVASQQPQMLEMSQSLARNDALQQAAARQAGLNVQDLLALNLVETTLNPLHMESMGVLIDAAGKVEVLLAEQKAQQEAHETGTANLHQLREKLYAAERALRETSYSCDRARSDYGSAASALQAHKNLPWRQMHLAVAPAVASSRPCWPKKGLLAAGALALAMLAASVWAVKRETSSGPRA